MTDFALGNRVRDRDDADPDPAVVVNTPDKTAEEWSVTDKHTVASFPGNGDYPVDADVVVVVFEDVLADAAPGWTGDSPLPLAELSDQGVPFYAFPAPRLTRVGEYEPATREVAPVELSPSPLHVRTFDVEENREYIDDVTEHGLRSVLVAREGTTGLELIEGHKRRWVAQQAGLDSVAVAVADVGRLKAAARYVDDHFDGLDEDERAALLDRARDLAAEADDPAPLADVLDEPLFVPDPVLVAIADRLREGGMTVEIDARADEIHAEKLGEDYVVYPDGAVEGGSLTDRVEAAVAEVLDG